ncbi:MAG: hypothetical protein IPK98_03175 [Chloracidobacterium sp.]|nr:hypothetical protein [Chloracidobacterium sp.]
MNSAAKLPLEEMDVDEASIIDRFRASSASGVLSWFGYNSAESDPAANPTRDRQRGDRTGV